MAQVAKAISEYMKSIKIKEELNVRFHNELFESMESYEVFGETHGHQALSCLLYLSGAIARGKKEFIDVGALDDSARQAVLDLLNEMPSANTWLEFITDTEAYELKQRAGNRQKM